VSDPTSYEPGYSFSGFQANNPTTPLPASNLDAELADISTAIDSHVAAIEDVRRSDGALKNGIVTYDSLALALQLIFDPTDGAAVAAAVATAQAAATAAAASNTSAAGHETAAAASAAAAAASAGSVNLALYLSKAGNLAGLGNADTARANVSAMKVDGSDATGRLAPSALLNVTDYNSAIDNGYFASVPGATNAPDAANYWLVNVSAADINHLWVTQVAYSFLNATSGAAGSVTVYRRHSYDNGASVRVWTPWISNGAVPVGVVLNFPATSAPTGYLKCNGALLSRATYPALYTFAAASGNIVSEASWSGGNSGAFSTGDLSTTFRLPDARGEFMRWYDDSRGVDSGRVIGANQGDLLKDHTHNYDKLTGGLRNDGTAALTVNTAYATIATGGVNGGLGGAETRPRNIALLACIKY
jgi:microcystin-dependent protein